MLSVRTHFFDSWLERVFLNGTHLLGDGLAVLLALEDDVHQLVQKMPKWAPIGEAIELPRRPDQGQE